MGMFLVSFFTSEENVRNSLVETIKRQGSWARITPTTWCIRADNITSAQLRDTLSNNTDVRMFVVDITNSSWASFFLPQDVVDWLKRS